MKAPGGVLAPADEVAIELIARLKTGQGVKMTFRRMRNIKFHRKAFSLLRLAFDHWNPPALEYKGVPVERDFDRFRRDLLILAGHYTAVTNLRGEVRLEAKSISFGNLDEDAFAKIYQAILTVVWNRVLRQAGYTDPAHVEAVVDELMRYAG